MDNLQNSSVQITLGNLQALQNRIAELEQLVVEKDEEIRRAQLTDLPEHERENQTEGRLALLYNTLRSALCVIQFSVANLHPLTVRGWPHEDLADLAERLSGFLPGKSDRHFPPELASTLAEFARLAKKWEDARARGEEQELLAEENAGRAVTPETLEMYGIAMPPPVPEDFGQTYGAAVDDEDAEDAP